MFTQEHDLITEHKRKHPIATMKAGKSTTEALAGYPIKTQETDKAERQKRASKHIGKMPNMFA